jgi:hypothetical protein
LKNKYSEKKEALSGFLESLFKYLMDAMDLKCAMYSTLKKTQWGEVYKLDKHSARNL